MDRDALPLNWIAVDWGSSQLRLWALDAEDRLMDRDMLPLEWIAADWGASQLRLWALDAEDRLLAQQTIRRGMARLTPNPLEPTVLTSQALVIDGGLGVTG